MVSLYLVRHAIAADRGPKYPDDTKRPLTPKGRARMKEIAAGLRALDPRIDVMLISPLVRAAATAEILKDGLETGNRRKERGREIVLNRTDALAPGGAPEQVAASLKGMKRAKAVALVGHEPDLGYLAAWLIGAREPLPFKKGGIARIDVPALPPNQNGQLVWFATPRMLRGVPTDD